jgi:hypothetical protein
MVLPVTAGHIHHCRSDNWKPARSRTNFRVLIKEFIAMRSILLATVALFGLGVATAHAQAPAPQPPQTDTTIPGARPGHEPGVGESLPLSNKASNIGATDTHSAVAPTLPTPGIGGDGGPDAYLHAARDALVAGRTGEAQQALEMAETRMLDRSVPPSGIAVPSDSNTVARITDARNALGGGDTANAIRLIDLALAH